MAMAAYTGMHPDQMRDLDARRRRINELYEALLAMSAAAQVSGSPTKIARSVVAEESR